MQFLNINFQRLSGLTCAALLCMWSSAPVTAEQTTSADTPEVVYKITPQDAEFLRYLSWYRSFGDASAFMHFGEIYLKSKGSAARVNLMMWDRAIFPESEKVVDRSGQIEQVQLTTLSRSEEFTLPLQSPFHISFFRNMNLLFLGSGSAQVEGDDEPPEPEKSFAERAPDKLEWEVQLRHSDSHQVLQVLNIAGIDKAKHYGDAPELINHTVKVHQELAGQTVYVQVIARRWGQGNTGLTIGQTTTERLSWSATSDAKGIPLPRATCDSLEEVWFNKVLAYADKVKLETGWVPDTKHWNFNEEEQRRFDARYNVVPLTRMQGQNSTAAPAFTPGSPSVNLNIGGRTLAPTYKLTSLKPNPAVRGEVCRVGVTLGKESPFKIVLQAIDGQSRTVLWSGSLIAGYFEIETDIPTDIKAGDYLILIESPSGALLDQNKLPVK